MRTPTTGRSPADPRQNLIVHHGRLLDVQEVAGALDDLHPRPGREGLLGVLDEGQTDTAVAVPVQVQGGLRPSASQRRLFSRVRAIRAEVVERRLPRPVVAARRRAAALTAPGLLYVAGD